MASLKKRGKTYYAQYYENGTQKRVNLNTESLQVAKVKLGKIEEALLLHNDIPLPTKTPVAVILSKYLKYLGARTSDKNLQKVITYLRGTFGPVCAPLQLRNQAIAQKTVKRPAKGQVPRIEVAYLEQLTAQIVSEFLADLVRTKGIAPKTVNHYRQVLVTLCNWAMAEGGVRFPIGKNPVEPVKTYKVPRRGINFLRLAEIKEQLAALDGNIQLQTQVATYIYAGLRREEGLWLTPADIEWDWGQHGAILVRYKAVDDDEWETKTQEDRPVPISKTLRTYLDRYVAAGGGKGPWFFPAPEGGRWDPDNFSRLLRETNSALGLEWTCLHFRHTFGSQLAMKGESLYKISTIMGNSPEICRKHYAALMPESLMGSVEFPEDKQMSAPEPPVPEPSAVSPRLRLVVSNR